MGDRSDTPGVWGVWVCSDRYHVQGHVGVQLTVEQGQTHHQWIVTLLHFDRVGGLSGAGVRR